MLPPALMSFLLRFSRESGMTRLEVEVLSLHPASQERCTLCAAGMERASNSRHSGAI